jgi:endonuclease/exonuclease/phosphatase family metal-dependent hydrolase
MKLTFTTWNIHSAIGTDGAFDLDRVARVLDELAPDMVALQEVGDFRGKTPHSDHAERLGRALGLHVAFAPSLEREGRRYGNAVLSRFPIADTRTIDLSVPHHEPRNALVATVMTPCRLALGCVHLGLGPLERREQETRLAALLPEGPLVVGGDFNHLTETSVRLGRLEDAARLLGARARTCPSPLPLFRFDRLLVSEEVTPLALRVHRSAASARASDHLPLVGTLELC